MHGSSWLPLLLVAPLAGQTFVVDVAGGPGSHYTNLATAVSSVPSGATLLVRAGMYQSNLVIDNKSLTVLGDPGVVVAGVLSGAAIRNLTPSQQVTIRGLQLAIAWTSTALEITACAGTVLVDSCSTSAMAGFGGTLRVVGCSDVRVLDSRFEQQLLAQEPGLWCQNSRLVAARSVFTSRGDAPGVQIESADVELADCAVGGKGGYWAWPAVYVQGLGNLRVLGASLLSTTWSPTSNGGWVVTGPGNARIDPSVTLASGGGPPFSVAGNLVVQPMPVLAAATGTIGGLAGASLSAPAGGIGALFVGLPGPPLATPLFADAIMLLPGTELPMALGPTGPLLVAAYVVPPLPQLLGTRVTWQGITVLAATWEASNAVTYVQW